jgi:hypothetical protein
MEAIQSAICERFGVECLSSHPQMKLGVALATLGERPLNGLRHPPEGDTSGWYVWGGQELSLAPDFFQPVHVQHLDELLPVIIPYLSLPAGWRFQVAVGHEDVWFDDGLLTDS